jgi:lysophospholipase L1-like esterase
MGQYNMRNVAHFDFRGYKQVVDPGGLGQLSPAPDYHVLAEGDSWFNIVGNTGAFKPRNVLDTLTFKRQPTALVNLARSGDTVTHISQALHDGTLEEALNHRKWDLILLSAGGNDLIDALTNQGQYLIEGKYLSILQSHATPQNYQSFINQQDLSKLRQHLVASYQRFHQYKVKTKNKTTPVLIHTYDYPTPNNAKARCLVRLGPWLYKALKYQKIPETYWYQISDALFQSLRDTLLELPAIIDTSFNVLNTCDTLKRAANHQSGNTNDWLNEIHPNAAGLEKIGEKLSKKISALI